MKISDDERREVAENLRTMTAFGCQYKEHFYELLEETVMPEWEFHSYDAVANRLADLIEPEPERTCNAEQIPYMPGCYEGYWCSVCHCIEFESDKPNYCPNCGAKVVTE